ncbi:MAG: HPF/RaiA family ribosome-associated protein, partial [Myxococcota bacterium]
LVERLGKVASRPQRAHVIFADDHGEAAVEIQLQVPRGRVHVGKALAVDHRSALDRAAARVRRQLQRTKVKKSRR